MPIIDANKDYYDILEIAFDSDSQEIKQAYRELARRYHPDSGHGNTERFRSIKEAYDVLKDATARRAYDRQRAARGFSKDSPIALDLELNRNQLPILDVTQMLYVMVDIRPRLNRPVSQQRLNLSLVIDRSTSMRGVRMRNVKIAAMDLLESLHPEDRLSLVAFSDKAEVLAPSTMAKEKRVFSSAIASLTPGGGTEIYQGLLAGLREVRRHSIGGRYTNHVILLTDGRTYGDEDIALEEAKRAGSQEIGISAFGIGEDWNDRFLDSLARYGGGISEYISAPSQVQDILREQIQGLSSLLARRMHLTVNTAMPVKLQTAFRAAPYMEEFSDLSNNTISLGNLTSGDPLTLILELLIEKQEIGDQRVARLELQAEEVPSARKLTVRRDVRVAFSLNPEQEQVPSRLLNFLSRLSIFRLQEKAWLALEDGEVSEATNYLQAAATHLFGMGYKELAQAAMLEVDRISQGVDPSGQGRKKLRYGTRCLSIPSE